MNQSKLLFLFLLLGILCVQIKAQSQYLQTNRITDWNTILKSGFYECTNGSLNAPNSNWLWGINVGYSGNNGTTWTRNSQIVFELGSHNMFFRSTDGNGLGAWAKVLHDQGNQTINGVLTVNGDFMELIANPPNQNTQSHTQLALINKGIHGNNHKWSIFTSSYAGAWGIEPNAFEIWEYPEHTDRSTGNSRRFVILSTRDNSFSNTIFVSPKGSVHLGYNYTHVATEHNDLSVNGNVGIGTTNSNGYKLAVNGTIRAKEVKVETGWADFVFEEDYQLPTLEEVATHIKEKKHLPDIPSAKEVEENGISLGEMNVKLLQKIEELTLYLIKQDEEIKELRGMIEKEK